MQNTWQKLLKRGKVWWAHGFRGISIAYGGDSMVAEAGPVLGGERMSWPTWYEPGGRENRAGPAVVTPSRPISSASPPPWAPDPMGSTAFLDMATSCGEHVQTQTVTVRKANVVRALTSLHLSANILQVLESLMDRSEVMVSCSCAQWPHRMDSWPCCSQQ